MALPKIFIDNLDPLYKWFSLGIEKQGKALLRRGFVPGQIVELENFLNTTVPEVDYSEFITYATNLWTEQVITDYQIFLAAQESYPTEE